jgi:hypothetical protein
VGALRGGSAPTRSPVDRLVSMGNAPGMEPALVDVEAATTAVIGAVVPRQELANFFDRSFSSVAGVLSDQDIVIQGPAFARFHRPPAGLPAWCTKGATTSSGSPGAASGPGSAPRV